MAITVISGCHPAGWDEYARSFVETFDRYWPPEIKLVFYTEQVIPFSSTISSRVEQRSLWDCPGQLDFIEQNKNVPERNGTAQVEQWGKRDHRDFSVHGWTWKFQAVKFSRQLFIPEHAIASLADDDIMIWMDSDVVTFDHVPVGMIGRALGFADVASLGRDGGSTELGFWVARVNDKTRELCHLMAECCRSGEIWTHNEWHSGYIFDRMVERMVRKDMRHRNMTDSGRGHVWFHCELGKYTDHLKGGKRKLLGYSPERFGRDKKVQAAHEAEKAAEQKRV